MNWGQKPVSIYVALRRIHKTTMLVHLFYLCGSPKETVEKFWDVSQQPEYSQGNY